MDQTRHSHRRTSQRYSSTTPTNQRYRRSGVISLHRTVRTLPTSGGWRQAFTRCQRRRRRLGKRHQFGPQTRTSLLRRTTSVSPQGTFSMPPEPWDATCLSMSFVTDLVIHASMPSRAAAILARHEMHTRPGHAAAARWALEAW